MELLNLCKKEVCCPTVSYRDGFIFIGEDQNMVKLELEHFKDIVQAAKDGVFDHVIV